MDNSIVLSAILSKAQTTIDGGWRITFDVLAREGQAVMELTKYREQSLRVVVIPEQALNIPEQAHNISDSHDT